MYGAALCFKVNIMGLDLKFSVNIFFMSGKLEENVPFFVEGVKIVITFAVSLIADLDIC